MKETFIDRNLCVIYSHLMNMREKKFILGILFIVRISLNKIIESVRIDEQNSLGKQSAYFRKSKLAI